MGVIEIGDCRRDTLSPKGRDSNIRHFPAGTVLNSDVLIYADVLLSGWAGMLGPHSATGNLIGVLLPGDRFAPVLDNLLCQAVALTPVSVILEEDNTNWPRELQHLIRQCVRTCHFSAAERVEDFFAETYERLSAVELADNGRFDLPLSQATLGNILGLSAGHVNRSIKQLEAEDRLHVAGRTVTLSQYDELEHSKIWSGERVIRI